MEYQVPQFIEVEDKIVGPLTLRQFIYLAGTAGLCVVAFFYLPLIVSILVAVPIGALGVALAFYKVNGKPFIEMMEAGFNYYVGGKLFIWKYPGPKTGGVTPSAPTGSAATPAPGTPRLTRGKLSELAWSLDVKKSTSKELES